MQLYNTLVLSYSYEEITDFGVPGIPIDMNYSNFALTTDCKNQFGVVCSADCQIFMVCAGEATPLYKESCKTIDATKPFCIDTAYVLVQRIQVIVVL